MSEATTDAQAAAPAAAQAAAPAAAQAAAQAAAPPAVYRAIASVAGAIAKEGIAKDKRNSQQGYNFRGIDDVYNALAPILSEFGLVVLPRVLKRIETERQTKTGGALFNVVVEVEFDFVAAEDGSHHVVKTFGEAMDSADKATNKAMSAAYKYAAILTFCIPTSGDNDADATTHEVAPRRQASDDLDIEYDEKSAQSPARRNLPVRQAPVKQAAAASQSPARQSPPAGQPAPASQPTAAQATPQPQSATQPLSGAAATTDAAIRACKDAGLTELGIAAMAHELSDGKSGAIAGLPIKVQEKLITVGVSAASATRWNAAGAQAADAASAAESEDDLPMLWAAPAVV